MRPRHLLAGKVIGIGLLGLAQLALVAGLAAALLVAGVFDAPAGLGGSVALVIPWFALGFALYAVAYATAGALASRQQNADTAGQPVTYTLLAVYFAGYVALASDMDGLLANVLTVFPLTAPLVLPARSALVGVPLWEHVARRRARPRLDLRARPLRRPHLRPRAPPQRASTRRPRRVAPHRPLIPFRKDTIVTAAPTPLARPAPTHHLLVDSRIRQLLWLIAAAAIGFLVPYVFADRLDVPRDVYYAIYVATVASFFLLWTRANALSLRSMLTRNWRGALVLGALVGALLGAIALGYDSTPHPTGLEFYGAIVWRGIVYGAADGLLLGAFPVLAVFTAFPFLHGRAHILRTAGTGALAIIAALALTAAYHLGYPDFRGSKITAPIRGTAIWTAPTLLTLNPVGSMIAHVGLHVTAVTHSYEGDTFLPPHAAGAPAIALVPCMIGGSLAQCGALQVAENPSDPAAARSR